jgi:transketolase
MSADQLSLTEKASFVRRETLRLHGLAPQTRLASSLSCVEILTVLYYGGVMRYNPANVFWEDRDRFIISKGHGTISLFPILADTGYFSAGELENICKPGSFLGSIPDPIVPGYETINGSLGHGLGVACGTAVALRAKGSGRHTFVLAGDGELFEGSIWEGVMFAAQSRLDKIIMIVDNNKACMLDFCRNIINLEPLEEKFRAFGWQAVRTDGHDTEALVEAISALKESADGRPKVLIADTVKGKGVKQLEEDSLSHIRIIRQEEISKILLELRND